jgi:2-polyprenyl-3-methyl-5-hydroxy-6-metoxy-1,4-benzoquinol methylase
MAGKEDSEYLRGTTQREVERLQKQHAWIQTCLKGRIAFAPIDLQDPKLRVLDVGCADGEDGTNGSESNTDN